MGSVSVRLACVVTVLRPDCVLVDRSRSLQALARTGTRRHREWWRRGWCGTGAPASNSGISVRDRERAARLSISARRDDQAGSDPSSASGRTRRLGSVFLNPGGPGGSGVGALPLVLGTLPAALVARFDWVSWDPRGVGASTAVQCFASQAAEKRFLGGVGVAGESFPVGSAQMSRWIDRYRTFGVLCGRRNGSLLEHVSTADTARDLDLLRRAVGDRSLNYLGTSYGTFLGATYANLFPNRVRAMVLTSNINPQAVGAGRRRRQRRRVVGHVPATGRRSGRGENPARLHRAVRAYRHHPLRVLGRKPGRHRREVRRVAGAAARAPDRRNQLRGVGRRDGARPLQLDHGMEHVGDRAPEAVGGWRRARVPSAESDAIDGRRVNDRDRRPRAPRPLRVTDTQESSSYSRSSAPRLPTRARPPSRPLTPWRLDAPGSSARPGRGSVSRAQAGRASRPIATPGR